MQALGIYTDKWTLFDESSEPHNLYKQSVIFGYHIDCFDLS
jgi:hypothetical protein